MRAHEFILSESTLITDVPNDDWLKSKISYAKERGRNSFGVPYMGSTTGYLREPIRLPVNLLKHLPGMRGEQTNIRHDDLKAIMKIMSNTGKLPLTDSGKEYAPFVVVAHNGEAWVSEGNHRIMAADKLGWDTLPVELKYFDGGERVKSGPLYPSKIGLGKPSLDEGVNDPAIFKVVFIIGGPGSGKSYVFRQLGLNALGYVNVNSDVAFEYLMKKHDLSPKMPPEETEKRDVVRQRAKDITANKSELALDGRLGIVIDGTGDDFEKVSKLKTNFDQLGYDNFLVVVNTKLDVARERNQKRARTVPDDIVVDSWYNVQNNIGKFAQIFDNISIIDNSGNENDTKEQIDSTYRKLLNFTNKEPNKPAAKKWIDRHIQQVGVNEARKKKRKKKVKYRMPVYGMYGYYGSSGENSDAGGGDGGGGVEEAEEDTPEAKQIVNTLKKAGYKQLGSGADATVWMKDAGQVLKIVMPESKDITQAAFTFKKFFEFCMQHQDLACLPKFIPIQGQAYSEFTLGGKQYMQISMEQLYPFKNDSFEQGIVWFFSDYVSNKAKWETVDKELSYPKTWSQFNGRFANQYALKWINLKPIKKSEYQLLYIVMELLYRTGKINKMFWDLHTENAMQRQDGTIVIIDPWFERYSGTVR